MADVIRNDADARGFWRYEVERGYPLFQVGFSAAVYAFAALIFGHGCLRRFRT
jgi:hypothetical protein